MRATFPGVSLRSTARLNLDFSLREKSCQRVAVGAAGRAPALRVVDPGELPLNITNLRILPGMGKIKLTAGSPEVGTRGKRYHHNNATLKRVA